MGKNYDAEKLSAANKIYAQIQQKKDDIIELERIAKDNNICLHKKTIPHIASQWIFQRNLLKLKQLPISIYLFGWLLWLLLLEELLL